jgi:MFS family permease
VSLVDEAAAKAGFVDARARSEFIRFGIACLLASLLNAHVALLSIVFTGAGHSLQTAGLLLSLFAIPVIVVNLLAGPAAARFGALATTRLSMALTIIGFGSLAFTVEDFWLALLSRLVHGIGFGLYLPSIMTYGQSRLNQVRFVSLVIVFSSLVPFSYALGPTLGEFMLTHYGRTAFFLAATAPAALGLLLTIGLRPLAKPTARGLDLSGALQKRFILPLLGLFAGGTLHAYSIAYLPPDLVSRGVALAIFFVPSTIATGMTRVAGGIFQRFQPRTLVASGVALMAFGLALISLSSSLAVIVAGSVAFGLGSSVIYPVVSAWLGQGIEPARRAGPQAVGAACFYMGLYGMPFPLAFLVAPAGYLTTSLLLAGFGLAVACVLALRGERVAR